MVYPAVRTGDFDGHLNYFNRMLESFSPPLASEGFQMYNPPLYYFVSALAFRVFGPAGTLSDVIRYAQLVNTASTFFSVVLLFLILRRVFSGRLVVVLSLSVVAFLPMCLVKAPSVSGDSTLTLLCTLTFYLWQRYSESRSRAFAALAGLAAGLCFLTRYTGLFMILGISAGFLYIAVRDRSSRRRALMDMCLYVSLAFAVSGWYYARNLMVFHHLFPINGTPEMFFFRQFPGYRDWSFYANVKALFINSPFNKDNIIESFPAGTYTTFWADGQRLFLGTWDPVPSIVALALSLMPTLLIIYGVFRGLSGMVSNGRDSRTIFLMGCILTLSMSLAAYALGTYSYPYYSMVKSFYVMFCIVPFICLLALGLEAWTARSGHITAVLWLASACALQMSIFLL
jgi:4-amino-4-deoxy-L-arabinose transferase-like glycosyltransferase